MAERFTYIGSRCGRRTQAVLLRSPSDAQVPMADFTHVQTCNAGQLGAPPNIRWRPIRCFHGDRFCDGPVCFWCHVLYFCLAMTGLISTRPSRCPVDRAILQPDVLRNLSGGFPVAAVGTGGSKLSLGGKFVEFEQF